MRRVARINDAVERDASSFGRRNRSAVEFDENVVISRLDGVRSALVVEQGRKVSEGWTITGFKPLVENPNVWRLYLAMSLAEHQRRFGPPQIAAPPPSQRTEAEIKKQQDGDHPLV